MTAPPARRGQLAAIGLVGGLLSGLLGVGGGVIMVPLLVLWAGYPHRLAHATSLTAIIPVSVAGIAIYGGAGEINPLWAACLAVGAVVGAQLGARVLASAGERPLKVAFGAFLTIAAVAMVVV